MSGRGPRQRAGSSGSEPEHRLRAWLGLLVAAALGLWFVFLAIGFIGEASSGHAGTASRIGNALGAVVMVLLAYACGRWAVHIEHRLRRRQPAATRLAGWPGPSSTASPAEAASTAPPRPRLAALRRRRYGPVGTSVIVVFLVALTIAMIVAAVSNYHQAQRTTYVQNHGAEVQATVERVSNTKQCSRGGCSWTAAVAVILAAPVGGARSSVVHYPDFFAMPAGTPIPVRVDPGQPNYAELPGVPFKHHLDWILFAAMALLFGFFAGVETLWLWHLLALRYRAAGPGSAGSSASVT